MADTKVSALYFSKVEVKMEKEKIDRINFLAKKSKTEGLTEEEKIEQKALRDEYIAGFRANLRGILDNTYIQNPDGTKTKVESKNNK
jgi:uncharacterized protein YnzC (UPF0291/DUF896 family)